MTKHKEKMDEKLSSPFYHGCVFPHFTLDYKQHHGKHSWEDDLNSTERGIVCIGIYGLSETNLRE